MKDKASVCLSCGNKFSKEWGVKFCSRCRNDKIIKREKQL